MNKKQPRKPSWQYHDLAQKIQAGPRQHSAKLVLVFLGSVANDEGKSHHGYESVKRHTGIRKDKTVLAALELWKSAGILDWEPGQGGGREGTNKYTLNIEAMKALVKEQGQFNSETGRSLSNELKALGKKLPLMRGSRYKINIGPKQETAAEKATPHDGGCNPHLLNVPKSSLSTLSLSPLRHDVLAKNEKTSLNLPHDSILAVLTRKPFAKAASAYKSSPEWQEVNRQIDAAHSNLEAFRKILRNLNDNTADELNMDSQDHYEALTAAQDSFYKAEKEFRRLQAELRRLSI
jgi:hypothetical protein